MASDSQHFDFGSLIRAEEYSDMKITCQGREFKAHKVVVCTQSPVLAAALRGPFEEAKTNVVEVHEFDPDTVGWMVDFLYTGDYKCPSFQAPSEEEEAQPTVARDPSFPDLSDGSMLQHVRVGAIGHYYDIGRLAKLSTSKFLEACGSAWHAYWFVDSAAEALKTTGDKGMYDAVTAIASQRIGELLAIDQFADLLGDFALEILRRRAEQSETDTRSLSSLRAKVQQLEADLQSEKANCEAVENRARRVLDNVETCIATLKRRSSCRCSTCPAQFQCCIEKTISISEPSFTLKCLKCGCKY